MIWKEYLYNKKIDNNASSGSKYHIQVSTVAFRAREQLEGARKKKKEEILKSLLKLFTSKGTKSVNNS